MDFQAWYSNESDLQPLTRTLRDMQAGDIVIGEYGNAFKTLAVIGEVVLLSTPEDHDKADTWYTFTELEKSGCKLKDSTTELTLKEIAQRLHLDVDSLRIKDE